MIELDDLVLPWQAAARREDRHDGCGGRGTGSGLASPHPWAGR